MARDGGGGLGTVLTWGIVGVGAYLIYQWWQSSQSAATAHAAVPAPTPTAAANTTAATPSASSVSALDALYLAMVQAAQKANPWAAAPLSSHPGTLSADQWGYYLGQVSGTPAPDALAAFPTFNRQTNWPNITAAQYWTGISPLLAQQKGMGGLGIYGGLGRWLWGTR